MIRVALRVLVVLTSLLALTLFATSARRYVPRGHTVDPFETAILESSARFVRHEPMYVEPVQDQPLFMPGFALCVAAIAGDVPPELWQVRALGLGATILVAILIALIVQLECGSWTLALAGGSLALLGQGFLASPPGIARPESLMLALVLLAVMTLRHVPGAIGAVLGAIPLAAAVFVEPQALWFVLGALASLTLERSHRATAFMFTAGLLVAAGYVASSRWLGPWFNFEAWDGPTQALQFRALGPVRFVGDLLLRTLGVWMMAALLSFSMATEPWLGRGGIWMCMGVSALVGGLVATQSRTFGAEAFLPSIVLVSLVGPLMIQRVTRHLAAWDDPDRPGGENVVLAAVLLQFAAILAAVPLERWLPGVLGAWPG
jgi:hypothetical protein